MKKKVVSLCLALLMAVSLITPSFAALPWTGWPGAYWPLQAEWIEASDRNVNDPDRIIDVTKKTYDLLKPYMPHSSPYGATEPLCELTSWAYETRGDLDNAILWLERQLEMDYWFIDNGSPGYIDKILNGEARMDYLKAARDVTVYALSDTDASPYKIGPNTGVWYGMPAGANQKAGSAVLFYLDFKVRNEHSAAYWINYYRNTSDSFRQALDGGVIECAFNFERYEIQDVLSADQYINETMATLGGLNATVLLRIGAEVTSWDATTFDANQYIQAFRKVATAARKYPNLQVVYSPDIINNRLVTDETYYPGDEYVDWVGVSAYHKTCYRNSKGVMPGEYDMDYRLRGSFNEDAWYGTGFYDYDPLIAIKHVADLASAHNKPMMISECGFPNTATKYGDTSAFAADQMNKFYSYLTMVYPQVKAVFYFNVDRTELEGYDFSIANKPALEGLYYSAIKDAGVYLDDPDGSVPAMWEPLSQTKLSASTPKLRLATYVSFPNVADAQVKYYVDGALVGTANKAPYYYDLDTAKLSPGNHTVKVTAAGGQFSREVSYTLTVPNRTAYANTQTVKLDGKSVTFETYALRDANGNDTNYIKIRDLALAVNGTAAQFEVDWDGVVNLRTGSAYTVRGVENQTPFSGNRAYKLPEAPTNVNGSASDLQAFVLTDDNNGEYTYYKLRDLGKALGFNVGYDNATDTVFIQTDKPYTDAD